jgi:hypothetical protein
VLKIEYCEATDACSDFDQRAFHEWGATACDSLPSGERADWQGMPDGMLCKQMLLR